MDNITPEVLYNTILAALGLYVTIGLVWYVLQIIANWKIFTKAGESGWKSIIPVYNGYVSYKIAWKGLYFWIFFILTIAGGSLYSMGVQDANSIYLVIAAVLLILAVVLNVVFDYKLAQAFGKGVGFTLGLIFLHTIFILILGLGDVKYRKTQD